MQGLLWGIDGIKYMCWDVHTGVLKAMGKEKEQRVGYKAGSYWLHVNTFQPGAKSTLTFLNSNDLKSL